MLIELANENWADDSLWADYLHQNELLRNFDDIYHVMGTYKPSLSSVNM